VPRKPSHQIAWAIIDRLKIEREKRDLSLRQLAELADTDAGTLSRAERHDRLPSLAVILDVARVLDVRLSAVMKKIEDAPPVD